MEYRFAMPAKSRMHDEQIALETECMAEGQRKYLEGVESLNASGNGHQTWPVRGLIKRALENVAAYITESRRVEDERKAGRRTLAKTLTEELPAEALAMHTLRTAFGASQEAASWTAAAFTLGRCVEDELRFTRMRESEAQRVKEARAVGEATSNRYELTQTAMKKHSTARKRRGAMSRNAELAGVMSEWGADQRVMVGSWLLDCITSCTPWFEARNMTKRGKEVQRVLRPTDELVAFLKNAHDNISLFQPIRLPMLCKPADWTTPTDGGYLTDCGGRMNLMKTYNKQFLAEMASVDMPMVYRAINAVQSTGWRINRAVLDVVNELWARGIQVGDTIPQRDPEPLPALPAEWLGRPAEFKKADYTNYKSWAVRAAQTHEANNRLFSKRMACVDKMNVANRFVGRTIYFPHSMDFRGRIYPMPNHLNPQGDDLAKGLLEFAEAKTIGDRGIFWLKVHTANCFGVDKVTFEERVAWTDQNMDKLLESAANPVNGVRFWMEADDAFMALAACFELAGVAREGAEYMTSLSIPMDGSCNGLQNFSAMLRDAVGGAATNLLPRDKPADIYAEVAAVVAKQVHIDALTGNDHAVRWEPLICRKLVKQPVMTLPYGATKNGMRAQLEDVLRKNWPNVFKNNEQWEATSYLANVVYSSIGQVVIAAREAMDWLRSAAKLCASEEFPVRWTAPSGLVVLQEYRHPIAKRIRLHIDGSLQNVFVNHQGTKLNAPKQQAGISPNLIHSFDAAHLMRTVVVAEDRGLSSFAMIHDSYGTHACDTDALHQCIRDAFIDQYTPNLLERLRDEMAAQLPPELAVQLPPLPPTGDLELALIRQSRYFFA